MKPRFIHPELFESDSVASLPIQARFLWVGLIVLADDTGRGRASMRALAGRIFPSEKVKPTDMAEWISAIESAGMIQLYQEDGTIYYSIPKWTKYQSMRHVKKSLCPKPNEINECPGFYARGYKKDVRSSVTVPVPVTVTVPVKVSGTEPPTDDYTPGFSRFWENTVCLFGYTRGSKQKAQEEWTKLRLEAKTDKIISVYQAQRSMKEILADSNGKQDRFPHLYRWIRDEYWGDDPGESLAYDARPV